MKQSKRLLMIFLGVIALICLMSVGFSASAYVFDESRTTFSGGLYYRILYNGDDEPMGAVPYINDEHPHSSSVVIPKELSILVKSSNGYSTSSKLYSVPVDIDSIGIDYFDPDILRSLEIYADIKEIEVRRDNNFYEKLEHVKVIRFSPAKNVATLTLKLITTRIITSAQHTLKMSSLQAA